MLNIITGQISVTNADQSIEQVGNMVEKFIDWGVNVGGNILGALIIYLIGRYVIKLIRKMTTRILEKRSIDPNVKGFLQSLVNISLTVLLIIAIISKLGIETTSFAALLASAGVAIGMAFSNNLSNFAGGVILLLLRPFKVGDYIECQNVEGRVMEIQIFHTVLMTFDKKQVLVPNGSLSGGTITNHTTATERRVEIKVGVEYGEDFEKVKGVIEGIIESDKRILHDPAPFVYIKELNSSSVDIMIWVWVKREEYWNVYLDMNRQIYAKFNEVGIHFPFPQLTIHQATEKKQ